MTKEQEEVIKLAKEFTKMDFSNPMDWTGYYDTELKELQECIKIVLNMLEEKDKEIDFYKKGLEREIESNRDNIMEIIKKDREIEKLKNFINYLQLKNIENLDTKINMANFINDNTPYTKDTKKLENEEGERTVDFTIQHFEKKVEAEGE